MVVIGSWRSKHHEAGAWSLSLDGDLDPVTEGKWVGPIRTLVQRDMCFQGTQLSYIGSRIAA
jgi:hypothetical protein